MSRVFFLPYGEADDLGLQGMDLSNSQTGTLPKSIFFFYCVLYEFSQKTR